MLDLAAWLLAEHRVGPASLLFLALLIAVSIATTAHILLNKQNSASAVAWTGLVWLSPLIGPLLYLVVGINRVQRKAVRLLGASTAPRPVHRLDGCALSKDLADYQPLARAVGRITGAELFSGNSVLLLRNGDEAYPAMLSAIAGARHSVSLLTYILDDDVCGAAFVSALAEAHRRGVAVRVLVDGIGALRSHRIVRKLRRAGVSTEVFLWSWAPWKMALINLRNHRKLLIVDGSTGFTGGMNIHSSAVHAEGKGTVADLHFRVTGPVLRQLQEQFVLDWAFARGEVLAGPDWLPTLVADGPCFARAIPDGPDEDLMKLQEVMIQALCAAKRTVLVLTPYFVPPDALAAALGAAALRGVTVEVLLPQNNVPAYMNRVAIDRAEPLLERGVRIGFVPGPFEHGKLVVVDEVWVLLGSTNWDPRSLRLNFELNVEVYDRTLARTALARLTEERARARWLTLDEVRCRPLLRRLLDAALRLPEAYL